MSKNNSSKILQIILLLGVLVLCGSISSQGANRDAYKEFIFAQGLFEEGKYGLAVFQFQKFIEDFSENKNCDKAQYFIGTGLYYQKEYKKAASAFQLLLDEYPDSQLIDDSLYQLGECYYSLDNYEKAAFSYEKLIEEYPRSEFLCSAIYSSGCALFELKKYPKALHLLKTLKVEFPDFERVYAVQYLIAKILYEEKKYSEAISEYSSFISNYSTSEYLPVTYLERGLAYLAEGEHDKAQDDFLTVETLLEKAAIKSLAPAVKEVSYEREGGEGLESREGPITGRRIERWIQPDYPEWAEKKGIEGEVKLKCWVLPSGEVSEVEVWRTSGWSELDKCASEALKKWKFESIEGKEIQWGIVTFCFEEQ